jgi:hypothetical protein
VSGRNRQKGRQLEPRREERWRVVAAAYSVTVGGERDCKENSYKNNNLAFRKRKDMKEDGQRMVELGKARGNRMRTFSERALDSAGCGISRAKCGHAFLRDELF